ncbi:MAG: hypothetical protein H8F28_15800 [Fibrella sp.]|nr:hypothetical protein [Armatimonadota bacterium]
MAHIELTWTRPAAASPAISTNNGYRDGTLIKSGVTSTSWEDMGVSSGRTYAYQVSGVAADGREGSKSETSSATAPFPPTGGWTAPTNLRIQGIWATPANRPTDVLTWDSVPGAVRYNVYLYDRLIGSSTSDSTFTVPVADYYKSLTYTVTAVDSKGDETLPSNIAGAQGSHNPAYPPSAQTKPPKSPITLRAATEWNAGGPRVRLTWLGGAEAYTYDIYRDGKKVAKGVWGQIWFDSNVRPGEQHTYAVTSVNKAWYLPVESPLSSSVSTVVTGQPILNAAARVAIKKIIPNDDSVMVHFDAVPGALDYRVSDVTKPGSYKYSAGSLSVEMNGLLPGKLTNLIVEAVDKLGPFQKMDGMLGPGATTHDGHVNVAINGLGDPSNVPIVLAASVPFSVSCPPRTLTGSQVFFDTFRDSKPFVPAPVPASLLVLNANQAAALENDRWNIYNVRGDMKTSRAFVMGGHFMDTLYDGGTPYTSAPLHMSKSSLVMQPKSFADIGNNKVLHVTFEVDAHFSARRWCDVIIAGAGDGLMNPGSFWSANELPTVTGQIFRWQILADTHRAEVFRGKDASGNLIAVKLFDQPDPTTFDSRNHGTSDGLPKLNGTQQDLDKRHRFDLYISRNRVRLMEEGRLIKDNVFPNGVTLPFNRATVYFVHQVYHSAAERAGAQMYAESIPFWMNHRPYADERHWDNMGFEVLNSFPPLTP